MPDTRKALVVYNPAARSSADPDAWLGTVIHRLCDQSDFVVTVRATRPGMSSEELLSPATYDLVLAAGGDGTVRSVVQAELDCKVDIPVGIIPAGTGNQLARNLGIYEENLLGEPLEDALKTILHGRPRRIDVGRMNGQAFVVAAGAGPMSDAVIMPGRDEKTQWKMLAYATSMVQTIALAPVMFKLTTGGDTFTVTASGLFVTNVAYLGIGTLSESAELDDGLLDLCILNPQSFTDYVELGFRFAGGLYGGEAPYYIRKVNQVDIEVVPSRSESALHRVGRQIWSFLRQRQRPPRRTDRHVIAMIDGDAFGTTPMHIDVVPHAISVCAPASERLDG